MKLRFSIHYHTEWGQSMHVLLTYQNQDGRERRVNVPLLTDDGSFWMAETTLMQNRQNPVAAIEYVYQVEDAQGKVLRREWNKVRRLFAVDSSIDYIFPDAWRDIPINDFLYSYAYRVVGRQDREQTVLPQKLPMFRKSVIFRVSAPQLQQGEAIGICGSHPAIGDWNPSRFLRMTPVGDHDWMLSVNVDAIRLPVEYKFVVIDEQTRQIKCWEEGDNRTTADNEVADGQALVLCGGMLRVKEPLWRMAGVAVPVFSLRSESSYGVGDFGDLARITEWAEMVGVRLIQILPVWDTTTTHAWTDSHPYSIISAFALHPHYIDLDQLGALADEAKMTQYNKQRRELNAMAQQDYPAVHRVKLSYIHDAFLEFGADCLSSEECKAFCDSNADWLKPYAAFCILRDRFHTARFADWNEYARYDDKKIAELLETETEAYGEIVFTQFHLHRQLKRACQLAHERGVTIKGDLPIGIYRDSVETWTHPELFHMDAQTACPPDSMTPYGQNWGFPTYRWEENTHDHPFALSLYDWFKRRFEVMEQYFDAIRVDHVVAFFRVWTLPLSAVHATLGHFNPALPLSEEEIARFGLHFRKELFTKPFVNDSVLQRVFGIHASYVKEHFMTQMPYGLYALKDEVNTQVKVRTAFEGRNDENSLWIRDGLYRIIANVLFIEDEEMQGMYHPRFMVYNEPVYEVLNADEKDAFMRLYNNYFYERHNDFWAGVARERIARVLMNTKMLVCAEDLGLLPKCVDQVLDEMRILPLQVQSMPKQFGEEFEHLEAYPYRSVCATSTHDMPTLRLWWEENAGRTQRYFATMMQKQGRAPQHMTPMLAEEVVARHLYSPSMLCVIPLQDWLAFDPELREKDPWNERINAPYDAFNQWKYRMRITIQQLMAADQWNRKVNTMVKRSKR